MKWTINVIALIMVFATVSTAFAGDISPVELRLSADLMESFDANGTAAGVNGNHTARGPLATITTAGAEIVDPSARTWVAGPGVGGIQYDVSAPNFSWPNYGLQWYDDYEMTVEFWWKRTSSDPACLFGVGQNMSPSGTGFWELTVDNVGIGVAVGYYTGAPNYVSAFSFMPYPFTVGDWHHLAMVSDPSGASSDSGTIKVYVDGVLTLNFDVIAAGMYQRTVYLNDHFWLTNNIASMVSLGGRAYGINDAGGDVTSSGGTGAGSGLGYFQQFKIWKGLKYEANFTPPARLSSEGDKSLEKRLGAYYQSDLNADVGAPGVNLTSTAQGSNAALWEVDGLTIVDASDSGIVGGVEYDVSAANYDIEAATMGDSDDYELTVEFWWKRTSSDPACLFGIGSRTTLNDSRGIELTADNNGIGLWVGGNPSHSANAAYTFNVDQWYHIALTLDPGGSSGGTTVVFVNGDTVITTTNTGQTLYDNSPGAPGGMVYWNNNARIQLGGRWKSGAGGTGGNTTVNGGAGNGSGLGCYDDLIITRGLRYRGGFTPTPRTVLVFSGGDHPVEERLRCTFSSDFNADTTAAGVNGVSTSQGGSVTLTEDGVSIVDASGDGVTGGVEYDVSAANYNWYGGSDFDDYELTVEFWWKRTSSDPACLFGIGNMNVNLGHIYYELTVDNTGIGYYVGGDGNPGYDYAAYTFDTGTWYHIAFVTDPSGASTDTGTAKMFVNGKLVPGVGGMAGFMRTVYMNNVYWHLTNARIQLGGRWRSILPSVAGGDVTSYGGSGHGSGLGVYDDFVITAGLKYGVNFVPPARTTTLVVPDVTITVDGSGDAVLNWEGSASNSYKVYSSSDLAGWSEVADIAGSAGAMQWTDTGSNTVGKRFYKVQVYTP